ncbi:MAG: acetyl-CoA C-acyltransferase, partial [Bacteroidota bacterium]
QNATKKAGLEMKDIGLHNFAEAFSASCLKYQRDLGVDPDSFNVNGGTMTMGHAQGASGAMITTTLIDEMKRRDVQFGLASISGGAGLGAATLLELV